MSSGRQTDLEAALFLLQDFLAREKERERRGVTVESLHAKIDGVTSNVTVLRRATETIVTKQIEQGMRQDRHAKKLKSLHLRFEGINGDGGHTAISVDEDPNETTSPNMRLEEALRSAAIAKDLKKKWDTAEAEKKEERIWWRRWWVGIVAAIVLMVFSAACSGAGNLVFWYVKGGKP
jgi:hypothetical protein